MASSSRLGRQIEQAAAEFNRIGVRFALIGGLALASHKAPRATIDVDFLADASRADDIHTALMALGYRCLHRSVNAGNYLRDDERLDLLYASRPAALGFLTDAAELDTSFGRLRVVGAEGLIALKLQGWVNDPRRTRDLEDIRALLRANSQTLNMPTLREYFRLFSREQLLEELINEIR